MQLKGEFLTISEMAERLGITYLSAKQRLWRYGIKPITTDTIYEASALKAISNAPGKGRPKKAVEPKPTKTAKSKKARK